MALRAAVKPLAPYLLDRKPKGLHCPQIARDPLVREMAAHLGHQLLVLPRHRIMPMVSTPLRDPFQGAGEPRGGGLALDDPIPLLRTPPVVSKAQKLEGLWFYVLLLETARLCGIEGARKPYHAGLLRMERQAIFRTAFRQRRADAMRIPFGGTHDQRVSRPREPPPRSLAELCMNVFAHTAPIIQP